MTNELAPLWPKVIAAKAPWQLVFGAGRCHAFDAFQDDDDSRRLIQQTIAFWRAHLEPMPQPAEPTAPAREIMAALYGNDTRMAAALLKSWVADHPDDGEAFGQYGRALAETGRYREAGQAYERAVALGNSGPGVCVGLGMIRAGEQRWKDAADLLERAVAAGFEDSLVLGNLGHAQLMLGKTEEGVRSYERALAAGIPSGAQTRGLACFNLACGYARLGKKDQAFEKLGTAIDEGFKTRSTFEGDADLATLKSDPRFKALSARLVTQ
jgi:tetratricopeptide (TPR) repeat protein